MRINLDRGRELLAVPAIHYRASFAEHVNAYCAADPDTRPQAIAVELGPACAAAVRAWLVDLGVSSNSRVKVEIPCMLGLIHANRRIHPRFKRDAVELQFHTRKPLNELPPVLLRKLLCYTAQSLLCLTPTDSIIEAIRCGIELSIPIYGVDLEEFAHIDRSPVFIQDPIVAGPAALDDFVSLDRYVESNERCCAVARDADVDGRRERAMAARIKSLLTRHKRVLLTCGLAHWTNLRGLLEDPAVPEAPRANVLSATELASDALAQYLRVLVHPNLATHQMDVFPTVTDAYQNWRANPLRRSLGHHAGIDYWNTFLDLLRASYDDYFRPCKDKVGLDPAYADRQSREAFESYLSALCVVNQEYVPSLFTVLQASEVMMSPQFCRALAGKFMSLKNGWARPSDPDPDIAGLPIVAPAARDESEKSYVGPGDKAQILFPTSEREGDSKAPLYHRSLPFYLDFGSRSEGRTVRVSNPWEWDDEPEIANRDPGYTRVWPPCDNRLLGTAYLAGEVAGSSAEEEVVEPFEGNLGDGIHVKATLRSAIRGERRLYVRSHRRTSLPIAAASSQHFPTVFLFEAPREIGRALWDVLTVGSRESREFVRNKAAFDVVTDAHGSTFIGNIILAESQPLPDRLAPLVRRVRTFLGSVVFGNPCLTERQSAEWLELTGYTGCPITQFAALDSLVQMYRERHHIEIDPDNWTSALVRFAIPCATRGRVVVIAPDHYSLDSGLIQEAHARSVEIVVLPISYFAADWIDKVRTQYTVAVHDELGESYPPALEELLNERIDEGLDMLPPEFHRYIVGYRERYLAQ